MTFQGARRDRARPRSRRSTRAKAEITTMRKACATPSEDWSGRRLCCKPSANSCCQCTSPRRRHVPTGSAQTAAGLCTDRATIFCTVATGHLAVMASVPPGWQSDQTRGMSSLECLAGELTEALGGVFGCGHIGSDAVNSG